MKNITKICAIMLCCQLISTTVYAQDNNAIKKSLDQLQSAVNAKDYAIISPILATNFNYAGIEGQQAKMILKQVIQQYPTINSITVLNNTINDNQIILNVLIKAINGESKRTLVLSEHYKFVNADIAAIQTGHQQQPKKKDNSMTSMEVPFSLSPSKMIVVQATVNGITGNFIVDSGTRGMLLLNSDELKLAGPQKSEKIYGVSGEFNSSDVIIKNFKWGRFEIENISLKSAALNHLAARVGVDNLLGLIGYELLKSSVVVFDYENQKLQILNSAADLKKGLDNSQILPFTMAYHIPVISCTIGNKTLNLGIDSGAQGNLLEPNWKNQLASNYSNIRESVLLGADQNKQQVTKVKMNAINIQGRKYEMDFIFGKLFGGTHKVELIDGLLGYPFLSKGKIALNFIANELYFLSENTITH